MVVRRALFVPYSAGCRRSLSSLIRVLALTAAAPDVRTFLIESCVALLVPYIKCTE